MSAPKNVLFLSAEAEPYVKVGGLGDVAGSLPAALNGLSGAADSGFAADVRCVIPLQPGIQRSRLRKIASYSLRYQSSEVDVTVFESRRSGPTVYFVDGAPIRASASVYSSDPRVDAEKYVFFSLAALRLPRHLNWPAHLLHVNDWHSAVAAYVGRFAEWSPLGRPIRSILTVHNLAFHGPDVRAVLGGYGVPFVKTDLPHWSNKMPLPLGLWAADAIVAVSPAYAAEMQTREFGGGLHRFLHKHSRRLRGILNGIDTISFDPARDAALFAKYSSQNLRRRSPNKQALQARLGLAQLSNVPILGVVSRLDAQKGMDLLIRALGSPRLARQRWQAVVLGHGDQRLEKAARELQRRYRGRVRVETRYDARLARQIYAGADILVMPSRYEPCGLAQMIAMRYGCVPLVRAVGGLRETVQDQKNGFTFGEPTTTALRRTLISAMAQYGDEARWRGLQLAGMGMDFSWKSSARQYLELYRTLAR